MKKKVVIVEDDQLLALILKKMAASIDLEVLTVSQFGREAVETILQENPDIIFMDISLADDFNGVEVMEIIRNHTRSPVIYITGISNNKLRRNAEKIENSCFLSKPIRLNELRQAVELMTVVS
ncbi:MAG: response regulator [Balneolaceae bacterium]